MLPAEKDLKEYSERIYTPLSENLKTTDTRVSPKPRFVTLGGAKWENQK